MAHAIFSSISVEPHALEVLVLNTLHRAPFLPSLNKQCPEILSVWMKFERIVG